MENNEMNVQNEEENAVNSIEEQVGIHNQQDYQNIDQINSVVKQTNNVDEITTNVDNSNKKRKHNNSLIIILIILVLAILGFGGYFVWDKYIKDDTNKGNSQQVTPTPQITPEITPTPQEKINSNYKCTNSDCVINQLNNKIQIITDGNDVVIYNFQENKILESNDLDAQKIYDDNYKLVGLSVVNEDNKYAYYDINKSEYITDFIYGYFEVINDKLIASFGSGCINGGKGPLCILDKFSDNQVLDIIDIPTKKIVYHKEGNWTKMGILTVSKVSSSDNNYKYYFFKASDEYDIFNSNFEIITSTIDMPIVLNDGSLIVNKTTYYEKYNLVGDKTYTSSNYDKIKFVQNYENYFAVVDNNKLKILNLNENLFVEFPEWNNSLVLLSANYYNSGEHFGEMFDEGIFVTAVESDKDFCNKNATYYYYNLKTKDTKVFNYLLTCTL